jgi:hypothetical protein
VFNAWRESAVRLRFSVFPQMMSIELCLQVTVSSNGRRIFPGSHYSMFLDMRTSTCQTFNRTHRPILYNCHYYHLCNVKFMPNGRWHYSSPMNIIFRPIIIYIITIITARCSSVRCLTCRRVRLITKNNIFFYREFYAPATAVSSRHATRHTKCWDA